MKKILITGTNGFIGTSVVAHLRQWPDRYQVDTISLRDNSWREASFRDYDSIYHLAGIVHMEKSKNDPEQAVLYEKINTFLSIELAKKAKAEGVKQFIFMSSASVYGIRVPVGEEIFINRETPLTPNDNYGISKARAETGILSLADVNFLVAILRPPTVYGKGCKGNYRTLSHLAMKLPMFPEIRNRRSMLYVENLAEFVRLLIENEESGIFFPQNAEFTSTSEMTRRIALAHGKKLMMVRHVGWCIKLMRPLTSMVDSAFGSLCYDQEISQYKENYCLKTLQESIEETERG